jgi:hypothetical protein
VPTVVVPSLKVTVPPGVPAPGATTLTVAVNVTDWPKTEGLADDATPVVVDACATVRVPVTGPLACNPLSPAKLADTELAYDPALIPVRLTPLSVAMPLPLVGALPTGLPFRRNAMDLLATDALELSIAVKVAVPPNVPLPLTALMLVAAAEVTVTVVLPELPACVVLPPYAAVT